MGAHPRRRYVDVVPPSLHGLRLTKHHGLGNDFLVALAADADVAPDPAVARAVCDRRLGVGADGLLYGLAPEADGAEVRMVLLNSDGSRAEISGNGLRCLVQAVLRRDGRRSGEVVVDTDAGRRRVTSVPTEHPTVDLLDAEMGPVGPGPAVPDDLPLDHLAAVGRSIGNPHLVVRVETVAGLEPAVIGPAIEAQVPGGVNVHLLEHVGADAIRLLHWERGAGVTAACGSGACVSASAARDWGLVGNEVEVQMPGGSARVLLGDDGVRLVGAATIVAEVVVA